MKKNFMMRLASFLLVAVLISTSAISGTYAKYVTAAESQDSARVAEWGVQVVAQSDPAFAKSYAKHDPNYGGTISVEAETKVVAPGTSSADVDGDVTFVISGTPEVATRVTVGISDIKDIYMPKGTYTDYTKHLYDEANDVWYYDTFELTEDYYPVVWTLELTADADANPGVIKTGTLAEIEDFLNTSYVADAEYAPNTNLDATFTLTWAWAFEHGSTDAEKAMYNAADTYLGNVVNNLIATPAAGVVTEMGYKASITVTQVD